MMAAIQERSTVVLLPGKNTSWTFVKIKILSFGGVILSKGNMVSSVMAMAYETTPEVLEVHLEHECGCIEEG